MQMLTVENIVKQKKGMLILDNVSLGVEAGEVMGLLGPGGAGKTTLIKLISGLSMPDYGNIYIGGVNLHKDFEKCMRLTGIVHDRPALYPDLTGLGNLRAAAAARGIPKSRVLDVIDMLELDMFADQKARTYSKGEAKLFAFAQAILHSPRLLLLDEATDGLDPIEFLNVRKVMLGMAHDLGTAVVMTSHRMQDIERTCKNVVVLENGAMIGASSIERLRKFGTGKVCQRMQVDRPNEAALYVFDAMGIRSEVRNGIVVFDCEQSQVPKMTALLFTAGYMVYEVRPYEITLEEAYYRLLKDKPASEDPYARDYYSAGGAERV